MCYKYILECQCPGGVSLEIGSHDGAKSYAVYPGILYACMLETNNQEGLSYVADIDVMTREDLLIMHAMIYSIHTLRNIILIIHSNTIAYKVMIAYGMRKKHPNKTHLKT
jgi:hypothetical protein